MDPFHPFLPLTPPFSNQLYAWVHSLTPLFPQYPILPQRFSLSAAFNVILALTPDSCIMFMSVIIVILFVPGITHWWGHKKGVTFYVFEKSLALHCLIILERIILTHTRHSRLCNRWKSNFSYIRKFIMYNFNYLVNVLEEINILNFESLNTSMDSGPVNKGTQRNIRNLID